MVAAQRRWTDTQHSQSPPLSRQNNDVAKLSFLSPTRYGTCSVVAYKTASVHVRLSLKVNVRTFGPSLEELSRKKSSSWDKVEKVIMKLRERQNNQLRDILITEKMHYEPEQHLRSSHSTGSSLLPTKMAVCNERKPS